MTKMLSSYSFPRNVYLKLENVQPSGSFKIRGIGWTMQEAVRNGSLQFVGSSGGNAGLAMAYAAGKLGKKLTLFVPRTTPAFMEHKTIDEGAEVFLVRDNWAQAHIKKEGVAVVDSCRVRGLVQLGDWLYPT